ncbi:hypothetical protein KHM19_17970 [Leptospira borgpetersenii]|nr:hypothetical protein LBBP_04098 [Leptospira borgpetersenii serovar Ballum]GIM19305.1 hypothetical protein KHM09_17560 [Leptospira borgpetersenii]GIM22614.1 hypothetical protein KHM19_17970 [Leptospira borgpetersenii]GIM25802.1 hypothetical protein KHM25_17270 [Leptospira borgpetersenii]
MDNSALMIDDTSSIEKEIQILFHYLSKANLKIHIVKRSRFELFNPVSKYRMKKIRTFDKSSFFCYSKNII